MGFTGIHHNSRQRASMRNCKTSLIAFSRAVCPTMICAFLATTCGTLPARAKNRSEFANAVLAYMEKTFVDSGDRDNLVKLLSTRCQLRIGGYDDIEFYLAFRGNKLKIPSLFSGKPTQSVGCPRFATTLRVPFAEVSSVWGFAGRTTLSMSTMPCSGMRRKRAT